MRRNGTEWVMVMRCGGHGNERHDLLSYLMIDLLRACIVWVYQHLPKGFH